MSFESLVASPDQLNLMKQVLDDYCLSHKVQVGTQEYEKVASRIVFLFSSGVTSLHELKATLATAPPPIATSEVAGVSDRYPLPYVIEEFALRHGLTRQQALTVLKGNKRSKEMADCGAEIFKATAAAHVSRPTRRTPT